MKLIKTEDAVGHVLCHDITQIIKGVTKDAHFRKGHIVTEEDIPLLFQHFVLVAAARAETEVPPLNSQALQVLMQHDWPGNIRELRNIAERYVLLGEAYNFDLI